MTKCLSFNIEQMPIGGRLNYSFSSGSDLNLIQAWCFWIELHHWYTLMQQHKPVCPIIKYLTMLPDYSVIDN